MNLRDRKHAAQERLVEQARRLREKGSPAIASAIERYARGAAYPPPVQQLEDLAEEVETLLLDG